MTFAAGVEAAATIMDDLDRGGWFAEAIRARAVQKGGMTDDAIVALLVEAVAKHLGLVVTPDDPSLPAVEDCMKAILARLQADGIVDQQENKT